MPSIRIANTGSIVETDMVTSILVSLQRSGVPILTSCGGKARCGKCIVRIVKGQELLSRKTPNESPRLAALGAGSDMRLACQTYTKGDIEISIVNLMK
jgi:adenylate cyclase